MACYIMYEMAMKCGAGKICQFSAHVHRSYQNSSNECDLSNRQLCRATKEEKKSMGNTSMPRIDENMRIMQTMKLLLIY